MQKNRREFLKNSCGALSMAALATQLQHFGAVSVMAQNKTEESVPENDYRALVCVFLSGGNDSNNMVVPHYNEGYAEYSAARTTQGLAVPRANLLPVTPPSMGGQTYGLHPALTALHPLWNSGKMAVVCNVGSLVQPLTRGTFHSGAPRPFQLYSHSDQVEQFQTAISTQRSSMGWGGRVADRTRAVNTGGLISMVTSLVGGSNIFSIGNEVPLIISPAPMPIDQLLTLKNFGAYGAEATRRQMMDSIRSRDTNQSMTQAASVITEQAISTSRQLSQNPTLSAAFPDTSLGNQLIQVAKIMKFRTQLNMRRQIFFVHFGNFDTHSGQLGRHHTLLTELSQAIKAFYDETVAQDIASQVTTFTISDFNRTFNPAGSGGSVGSDHAWGGHHFVVGGAVLGGDFYGRPTSNGTFFPTLVNNGPDDADFGTGARGRFIPSVSVEQYAATLARWFGLTEADMPLVFPNINNFSTSNLGFLS